MKRIALIGSSMNPPTLGHYRMGKFLLNEFDEVWYIPNHKHVRKQLIDSKHRLKMCQLMLDGEDKLFCSDIEIKYNMQGPTIDLIKKIKELYDHDFYFVIGQDNANKFHRWREYQKLLKMIKFVVLKRNGYVDKSTLFDYPHEKMNFEDEEEISSTIVRNRAKNNESIDDLVHPKIRDYILKHKLY